MELLGSSPIPRSFVGYFDAIDHDLLLTLEVCFEDWLDYYPTRILRFHTSSCPAT
jgi:hypothetical protein